MALSALKTWSAGEILTASDLNAEFANVLSNGAALVFPATTALDMNGYEFILDADADSSITADTDDRIDFKVASIDIFSIDATAGSPINGIDLIAGITTAAPVLKTNNKVDIGIEFMNVDNEEMLALASVASAVNEITITNSATGNAPIISSTGTDANVGITITPKGTGTLTIGGHIDNNGYGIADGGGRELLTFTEDASAVNHINLENNATGSGPILRAAGDDANVDLNINSKADGHIIITAGATGKVKLGNAALQTPNSDGAAKTVLITDGAAILSFSAATYASGTATASILPLPRGYLSGFLLSNAADADHDITISVGQARNTGDDCNLTRASAITKQIDATWAAGTAAGGMNAAMTVGNATFYHVFLISTPAGTVDAGFDTSITATNLLADAVVAAAGYTKYRRIGSVRTDGSANIIAFTQRNESFIYNTLQALDVSTTAQNYSAATNIALDYVPPGVSVEAIFALSQQNAPYSVALPAGVASGSALSETAADLAGLQAGEQRLFRLPTDTSQQIIYKASDASSDLYIQVYGWVDSRGRFD